MHEPLEAGVARFSSTSSEDALRATPFDELRVTGRLAPCYDTGCL
jgi:hypothetical protein